ncbi:MULTISPECIES: DUF1254 domain-containing protein [Polaromonas]|uniref:DUF1254 domain-containing protein n=1 Tax=Polaromonas aquatica TaxID=332657 RepID=A0ABW1U1R5_9BURK
MKKSTLSPASRLKRLKRVLLILLVPCVLIAGVLYTKGEQILLGAEGYIFGYPLVIMDATRANAALTLAPENTLHRVRQFPDASFRDVVRPNVDTLYTSGFIDMARGPWVFEMSANDKRYEVMPFMDAWTNVFAAPGTRTTGTAGGRFLLAGRDWTGQVPQGLTLLRSPTQMVWLIGRTQTNGAADYPAVHGLQDGISLRSLAEWQAGKPAPVVAWQAAAVKPVPPVEQMRAMGVETFFTRLAMLMVGNPPAAADGPMLVKLSRIGVTAGQAPNWSTLDRWAIALGRWLADFTVAKELKKPRDLVRGWSTPPAILGNYGTFYNARAVVAMIGLGANLPADATYPNTAVDGSGQALDGSRSYRLHFKATELPPVNAFWSITAYGSDNFFIDNPLHRYALGDRDPLVYNPDGSLDLWMQAEAPAGDKTKNWLPVKSGKPFLLNARLYWPKPAALNGAWGMPAVERVDQ